MLRESAQILGEGKLLQPLRSDSSRRSIALSFLLAGPSQPVPEVQNRRRVPPCLLPRSSPSDWKTGPERLASSARPSPKRTSIFSRINSSLTTRAGVLSVSRSEEHTSELQS